MAEVTPHVVQVGTSAPRTGGWCEHCGLPSMIECDMFALAEEGVTPMGVYRECLDCGRH